MPSWNVEESGHVGEPLVSLAGVKGWPGRGRIVRQIQTESIPAGQYLTLLEANSRRISACLQNVGANAGTVVFSATIPSVNYCFDIQANETFWINQDFPWTGQVRIYSVAGTSVRGMEILVP